MNLGPPYCKNRRWRGTDTAGKVIFCRTKKIKKGFLSFLIIKIACAYCKRLDENAENLLREKIKITHNPLSWEILKFFWLIYSETTYMHTVSIILCLQNRPPLSSIHYFGMWFLSLAKNMLWISKHANKAIFDYIFFNSMYLHGNKHTTICHLA